MDEAALNPVRDKHYEAHIHWEWWTASNGAAFHNPDQTTESLNKSMTLSQEGDQDPRRCDGEAPRRAAECRGRARAGCGAEAELAGRALE